MKNRVDDRLDRGQTPASGQGLSPRMRGSRSTNDVERDGGSKMSHPALADKKAGEMKCNQRGRAIE